MITFTGSFTQAQGTLASLYTRGDTVTGYIEFTTSTADLEADPDRGEFESTGPGIVLRFSNGASYHANGTTESFWTVPGNFATEDQLLILGPTLNNLQAFLTILGTTDLFTSTAYPSYAGAILPSVFLAGALALFDYPNGNVSQDNFAIFEFDSFSIPEPATYVYSGFGLAALAAWRLTKLASKRAGPGTAKGVCR